MDPTCELQKLYESGLRFSLSNFQDGGYTIKVGNYISSHEAERVFGTVEDAVSWLKVQVAFCQESGSK